MYRQSIVKTSFAYKPQSQRLNLIHESDSTRNSSWESIRDAWTQGRVKT